MNKYSDFLRAYVAQSRFNRLGMEFFWVSSGYALTIIGGLVGVRFLTEALSPSVYGELALGMTLATLTNQLAFGPISNASLRFFSPAQEAAQTGDYFRAVGILTARSVIVILLIFSLLTIGLQVFGYDFWLSLVAATFFYSIFYGGNSVLNGVQNAARHRKVVAWHQGFGQWLRYLAAIGCVFMLGASSSAAMWGFTAASLLVLGSQLVFLRIEFPLMAGAFKRTPPATAETWTTRLWQYSLPFSYWGIFTWAQMASDRWALQLFASSSTVGLFTVLYQLGYYPLTMFSGVMAQLVSPVIFSRAGDGTDLKRLQNARQLNNVIVFISMLITAIAVLTTTMVHQQIFAWLAAPEYKVVSPLLPLMVLSGGLFATGQLAVSTLLSTSTSQILLKPKIVTALIHVVLNFAGAYQFGLEGVVWATVIATAGYLLWIMFLSRTSNLLQILETKQMNLGANSQ